MYLLWESSQLLHAADNLRYIPTSIIKYDIGFILAPDYN